MNLEPIKARLDLASGSTHSKWAHSDLVNNAPADLAALVAEVERLRQSNHEEVPGA
jgi:hypothetical protein